MSLQRHYNQEPRYLPIQKKWHLPKCFIEESFCAKRDLYNIFNDLGDTQAGNRLRSWPLGRQLQRGVIVLVVRLPQVERHGLPNIGTTRRPSRLSGGHGLTLCRWDAKSMVLW
jgi:hypothetical protein